MNLWQTLKVAFRAILRNKLRSLLTSLGIILGVGAVILMMAIGAGMRFQVEQAFAAMGTNLLIVQPGSTVSSGVRGGYGSMPTLTYDDLAAVRGEVPTVRTAAPVLRSNQSLICEEANWMTSVTGTTPEYFDIRDWPMESGPGITQQDVDSKTKVVVLGKTVVEKLFGSNVDPVGQSIRIGQIPFTIVGVAIPKGQSSTGQDFDDAAFIPYTTFATKIQGKLNNFLQGQIYVEATSSETTDRAQKDVTALLRDRHRLGTSDDDDFQIRNMSEIASARQQGTETITTFLAVVAAVSLVVGGIGIMNIMLVSVTERTREIGLRMALGAKPGNIMTQFLIEALSLSVAGGAIGIGSGLGIATWVGQHYQWPILIQPDVIVASVVFSATVGIVFGLYPAWKAAQLDPIDALRYE
jgi:putative ABC transport system permease protein